MPHDRNGQPLLKGDPVALTAKVADVYPGDGACNAQVRIDSPADDGPTISLNSKSLSIHHVPSAGLFGDLLGGGGVAGRFVSFDASKLDYTQVKPMVTAACKFVEPAVVTPGNLDKQAFDRVPDLVDEMIRTKVSGGSPDEVVKRWDTNNPAPAGRSWKDVLNIAAPYLKSALGGLIDNLFKRLGV